jgi:hypothetical protein
LCGRGFIFGLIPHIFYTFAVPAADAGQQKNNSHTLPTQTMRNLSEALLVRMGRLHLYLRHKGRGEAQQELHRKYQGQYRNAGLVLLFDLFMALAVVVVVAIVTGILYFLTF